jgi:hypothetical protein
MGLPLPPAISKNPGSPVTVTDSSEKTAMGAKPLPVVRWQSRQWQLKRSVGALAAL